MLALHQLAAPTIILCLGPKWFHKSINHRVFGVTQLDTAARLRALTCLEF